MGGIGVSFDSRDDHAVRERIMATLADAGVELYRVDGDTVLLAERIRMHLMDSGVAVELSSPPQVTLAVRCQRSDFPSETPEAMYNRVRRAVADKASEAGFTELTTRERAITNPVDDSDVLDVWYEVVFARSVSSDDGGHGLLQATTWALALPKCVDE